MRRKLEKAIERWLFAESQGPSVEADRRLSAVFRARGIEAPRADFVARTMARLGSAGLRADRLGQQVPARFLDWAFKVGVAASLLLAAVSTFLLSGMAGAFARSGGGEHALDWGVSLLVKAGDQVARSLALWEGLQRVAGAIAAAMVGPGSLAALAAGLIVSLTAFRFLTRIVASERSVNHA